MSSPRPFINDLIGEDMPHIRVLFVEDEAWKALLRQNKTLIREVVAYHTGYALEDVTLIPEMIRADIADLADNLLPIEFVIDAGVKCAGRTEEIIPKIELNLTAAVDTLHGTRFGIWLRTMVDNSYILHSPG